MVLGYPYIAYTPLPPFVRDRMHLKRFIPALTPSQPSVHAAAREGCREACSEWQDQRRCEGEKWHCKQAEA